MKKNKTYFTILFAFLLIGCNKDNAGLEGIASSKVGFEMLRKDQTGLDFENELHQTSEFNVFNYMYFFNGGGVAAGDFNNDGLVDLFFTNNMGPNKMFLNEGNLKFKDITGEANMAGMEGWTSGVTTVDINNDGMLDLYVSQMGNFKTITGQNQLYVCKGVENGIPKYEDQTIPYGLDLIGFSTQAVFFDYDLDGDLDMYQLNHSLHENGTFGQKKTFIGTYHPESGDKLMRNDGDHFTDVTRGSGINSTVIGYGLGVVVGDINLDGWPDIYVGNDFHENDYFYINQKNGTFKEELNDHIRQTSRFSMGVDMADINNDGQSEIISLDMHPEDPAILKASLGEDEYGVFRFKLGYGYNYQYARNALQLNNGDGSFSEIGRYADVYATDWSWAPLFLDFDHDGLKDLFISNGIPRRMNDIDYVNFRANNSLKWKQNTNNLEDSDLVLVDKMPQIKLPNKFFRNTGKLRFEDIGSLVDDAKPSYSNGAAFADFDNDGDLDVVVNNLGDEPFLYKNKLMENGKNKDAYLEFELKGTANNIRAIGAKIIVYKTDELIIYENYPVRGYQSCIANNMHIGVGEPSKVEMVAVIWPDGTFDEVRNPVFNKKTILEWQPALAKFDYNVLQKKQYYPYDFQEVKPTNTIPFKHKENDFVEFHREGLIPHMVSSEGPAAAVGDANGDGLDDVFFGSAKFLKSALYYQKPDGSFYENTPETILKDTVFEDVDAKWADLDNDGDQDLVIAAGGNEFWGEQEAMKQRAYLNDGNGQFSRMDFPGVYMTASCVLTTDFNNDGKVDLFFGARAIPWKYGLTPHSVFLENKGGGEFEDVTNIISSDLQKAGLVKDGVVADMDGDGQDDLVLTIEWEPITIFYNKNGHYEKSPINDLTGWWNYALPFDYDGDGDLDLLAGNLGENSKLRPSKKEPVKMYVNDFDGNDQVEQIVSYFMKGREIPFANFMEITKQLPPLKKKFLYAKDFAASSLAEIFGQEKLAASVYREANTFQSMLFENKGKGHFEAHQLPKEMQLSDQQAAFPTDLDGDGQMEVLTGGNFYDCNIEMGRYDADYGHVLRFSKNKNIEALPLGHVKMEGQVRRIVPIKIGNDNYYIFVRNNDKPLILRVVSQNIIQTLG